MNKYFISIFVLLISATAFSESEIPPAANIKVSPEWAKAQCASLPGKGITLAWSGLADKRSNSAVGTMKKKDQVLEVALASSMESVVGEAVKTVFENCGFNVETKKGADGIEISVEVTEFFAGAKKGFFTGETEAKGLIALHFAKSGASYDFNLGATKADKRLKKKNIEQLEGVLTGLLESVVTQIAESPALLEEIKKLAAK
jgi:uncharacterized lipoprotein YajG